MLMSDHLPACCVRVVPIAWYKFYFEACRMHMRLQNHQAHICHEAP